MNSMSGLDSLMYVARFASVALKASWFVNRIVLGKFGRALSNQFLKSARTTGSSRLFSSLYCTPTSAFLYGTSVGLTSYTPLWLIHRAHGYVGYAAVKVGLAGW